MPTKTSTATTLTADQRIERIERALAGLTMASRGVMGKRFLLQNPELVDLLEEVFDDEVSDEVLNRFVTVGDIATYFGRHVSAIPNPQFRASVAA